MVVALLIGVFLGFAFVNFSYIGPHEAHATEFTPVSYTDYVTILLSAITILLAILGTFLALVAVVGYTVIRQASINHAGNAVNDLFKSDGAGLNAIMEQLQNNTAFQDRVAVTLGRVYYTESVADTVYDLDEFNEGG